MGLRDLLSSLAPTFASVRDRRGEIEREIAKLAEQRAAIVSPVLPLDDFIAWQLDLVDAAAARGERAFDQLFAPGGNRWGRYLAPIPADQVHEDTFAGLYSPDRPGLPLLDPGDNAPHVGETRVRQDAFCALLAEAIKPGLERVLRARLGPTWPAEVGLPRAERTRRIEALNARIRALQAEREELERVVREAADQLQRETSQA